MNPRVISIQNTVFCCKYTMASKLAGVKRKRGEEEKATSIPSKYALLAVSVLPEYAAELAAAADRAAAAAAIAKRTDIVQFESKSRNEPVGHGAGERLGDGDGDGEGEGAGEGAANNRAGYADFVRLNGRQRLSNFCAVAGGLCVTQTEGGASRMALYAAVENGFHAGKALLMAAADADAFLPIAHAFEVGQRLGVLTDADVKREGGKKGSVGDMTKVTLPGGSTTALQAWEGGHGGRVLRDAAKTGELLPSDADLGVSEARMRGLLQARLSQDAAFRGALTATGTALLVHHSRGMPDLRLTRILHSLRAGLRAQKSSMQQEKEEEEGASAAAAASS